MLIVAVEDATTDADTFWNSVPVKSTLPTNSIVHRIKIPEDFNDFQYFAQKFQIMSTPAIYVFGSHSSIISYQWVGHYPKPEEFASYIGSLNYGAFEKEDENITEVTDTPAKPIKISLRTDNGLITQQFDQPDTLKTLFAWLDETFGPNHTYTVILSQKLIPRDYNMLITDVVGKATAVLLKINEPTQLTQGMTQPTVHHHEGGCCHSISSKIFMVLSFINPFASEGEQESFWEYQPSNNPDIAQVLVQNIMG